MPAPRHPLRRRIMTRIHRGDFASVMEIMLVASVPRQTANRWLREAGIDRAAMRMRQVARMHQIEEEYLAGLSGAPRKTARQRWIETSKAVRKFNEANAKQPRTARENRSKQDSTVRAAPLEP